MLIYILGPWKKTTHADLGLQLNTITNGANTYKSILGIPTADVERLQKANTMMQYIGNARGIIAAWSEGITAYEEQLRNGVVTQQMMDFPELPVLGTAPDAVLAGIWHFIENRRIVWMSHSAYNDTIGQEMAIVGPTQTFETDNYKPKLAAKVITGSIEIKTDSAIIDIHNLYAAISGQPLKLITSFKGSKYSYLRQLAASGQAESVDLKVRGVYKNQEIGLDSDIITIAYKG